MDSNERSARTERVFARLMYSVNNPPVGWEYDYPTARKGNSPGLPLTTVTGTDHNRRAARDALVQRQIRHKQALRTEADQTREARDSLVQHQGITILTQLSGTQYVTATATNMGRRHATLTVAIGTVSMTFRTKKAALRYAKVWTANATYALTMPRWNRDNGRTTRYIAPGVIVTATEQDKIMASRTPRSITIVCGRVSWEVLDDQAFNSIHLMWREVIKRAKEIWPR